MADNEGQLFYEKELKQDPPELVIMEVEGENYLAITTEFIDNFENDFDNSLVFNASCQSFKNEYMSQAFEYKGVKTYFGFTDLTPYKPQPFAQDKVKEIFNGLIKSNKTAGESFDSVTSKCLVPTINTDYWRLVWTCLKMSHDGDFEYSCDNSELSITIDGDPGDWDGINPIIDDSAGNAPNDYADFRKLYVTHDDSYIYFLAEFENDLEVTEYPDSPWDLGIDYADLVMQLDTDLDVDTGCNGAEFGLNINNMWHPAYNDYGWLGDIGDCGGTSAYFTGAVSTAIQGRFIESSVSRDDLETLTPNMRGFDLKLAAPLRTNIARYWLDGTNTPGPVFVDPTGGLWKTSPQIIKVNSSNADRIYCTIRTSTDGSIPPDPPEPTRESHDPFDVGVDYVSGSSGDFVFWESNSGIKNLKVRFRGYNDNDYGPTSDVYFYRIDFPPTIAQTPMSGSPGTTFVQWGTGFTPNSAARLHFRKPDGSEYPPVYQNLDEIGHFEIEYTAPLNKPAGIYTWWAIDLSTDEKSNKVSYRID